MKKNTRKTRVFTPLTNHDRLRCAYIGNDGTVVTLWERSTELGKQEYAQVSERLIHLSHRSTAGSTVLSTELARIVLHDCAASAVALAVASGYPVDIDIYPDNGSENTRARGLWVQSLYIRAGRYGFSLHDVSGLISSGFTLQGKMSRSTFSQDVEGLNADTFNNARGYWCGDIRILRYEEDPARERQTPAA